jgi:hypothetical protein
MIKECPTCKRTYSDPTITFCLADGSLLSAPFDPQATLHLPASHQSEAPATEIIPPAFEMSPLPLTEPAIPGPSSTDANSEADGRPDDLRLVYQQDLDSTVFGGLTGRRGVKLWVVLGILFTVAAIYTVSIIPAIPALAMFVLALWVGLKKRGFEHL